MKSENQTRAAGFSRAVGRRSSGRRSVFSARLFAFIFTFHFSLFAFGGPADDDFLFAYKLMQRGDLQEAGTAFDTFLEKFPNDDARGDALYFRAALHRKAGEQKAAADVLTAITPRTAPRRVPAYVVALLRGQVLTDLGRYDEAVAELEKDRPGAAAPGCGGVDVLAQGSGLPRGG